MSADNGTYILKTLDNYKQEYNSVQKVSNPIVTYRVTQTSAIDNFEWYEKNQLYMLGKYMYDTWGKCKPMYNFKDAIKIAKSLESKCFTEYGINEINASNYSFN